MSEAPLISAWYCIGGRDFDPDEVTRASGLEPTEIWRAPEVTRDTPELDNVNWIVGFRKVPYYSTEEAVAAALDLVWPYRERLTAYVAAHPRSASLECTVTIEVDRPVYELSVETMKRLVELECEFGLDVFDYSE